MYRAKSKFIGNKIYIYQINDNPDKDISHWTIQDFEWLEEVRFRKPVVGHYIGYVKIDKNLSELFNNFYDLMAWNNDNSDPYDYPQEGSEEYEKLKNIREMLDNLSFDRLLKNIQVNR